MTSPMRTLSAREGAIVAVSIRLGWRGQPVVQIKRQLLRARFVAEFRVEHEPSGSTEWRDAGKADAIELAQYLAATGSED